MEKWFDVLTIQPLNFDEKLLIFLTLWCFLTLSFDAKNNVSVRESFNWIDCIRNLTRLSRDKRHYWMEKNAQWELILLQQQLKNFLKTDRIEKRCSMKQCSSVSFEGKEGLKMPAKCWIMSTPPSPHPQILFKLSLKNWSKVWRVVIRTLSFQRSV